MTSDFAQTADCQQAESLELSSRGLTRGAPSGGGSRDPIAGGPRLQGFYVAPLSLMDLSFLRPNDRSVRAEILREIAKESSEKLEQSVESRVVLTQRV
jgi:hypothetical protein